MARETNTQAIERRLTGIRINGHAIAGNAYSQANQAWFIGTQYKTCLAGIVLSPVYYVPTGSVA